MTKRLMDALLSWPQKIIHDQELAHILPGSEDSRYSLIKRAVQEGVLLRLKKGLFLIPAPYNKSEVNRFAIAQMLHELSFISFESALSYHGWIPEAVHVTTSATIGRAKKIDTPVGQFSFVHLPRKNFLLGVERIEHNGHNFLIATPGRALADLIAVFGKPTWQNMEDILLDLRVDTEELEKTDAKILLSIAKGHPNVSARMFLQQLHDSLVK